MNISGYCRQIVLSQRFFRFPISDVINPIVDTYCQYVPYSGEDLRIPNVGNRSFSQSIKRIFKKIRQ